MNNKPRILVLTLSFGAGHVSAAQSVIGEFQKQIPEADLRMMDALENCSLPFRIFYVWTYHAMIRYAPRLWGGFFSSRVKRGDEQTAPVWIWRNGCRKVFEEIRNFQPDLIVAAEVGACEIAVIARRANLTRAPVINVITDFEAEPIWVKPEISTFAVATQEVRKQLKNWGADAEKIKVCGIPLSPGFAEQHNSSKIKIHFGLDARPMVLLMGGGTGPTSMNEVAARLLESEKELQIIALPAGDETAKLELKKLHSSESVTLKIIAWTNLVAELMSEATVLVTKPGGLTLSEAAVSGLPLVLFDPIPGPEEANAARFVQAGAAVLTKNSAETAAEILRLLHNPKKLKAMSEQSRSLAKPDAARKIVELALQIIDTSNRKNEICLATKKLSFSRRTFGIWRKFKKGESFSSFFAFVLKRKKPDENLKEPVEAKI